MIRILLFVYLMFFSLASFAQPSDPVNYSFYLKKAHQAEERYLYQEAVDWYRKAIELNPGDWRLYLGLGKQHIGLNQLEEAYQAFSKVVEINPKHAETLTMIGIYFKTQEQDFEKAIEYYEKAIEADAGYERPRHLLGGVLMELHRYDEAKAVYEELVKTAPESPNGYYGLGQYHLNQKEYEEAEKALRKAILLDPADPDPHRDLGRVLSLQKKMEEARAELKLYQELKKRKDTLAEQYRLLRINPKNPNRWFQAGIEYIKARDNDRAIECLEKGLELAPGQGRMHSLLGALYLKEKQPEKALPHLEKVTLLENCTADDYNNLGVCYLMVERYNEAIHALEAAIKRGKNDARIRQNLNLAIEKSLEK